MSNPILRRLKSADVLALRIPGRYRDGRGLFLIVRKSGYRHWAFEYRFAGRNWQLNLGSPDGRPPLSRSGARREAARLREELARGKNPKIFWAVRRPQMLRMPLIRAGASVPTLANYARAYVRLHFPAWRDARLNRRWLSALFGPNTRQLMERRVDAVSMAEVNECLRPLWKADLAQAEFKRACFEAVLLSARRELGLAGIMSLPGEQIMRTAAGGVADRIRASPRVVPPPKRREAGMTSRGGTDNDELPTSPALTWRELPAFITKLQKQRSIFARALEFSIYCNLPPMDALQLTWGHLDYKAGLLYTQPIRGNAGSALPLSHPAMEIIADLKRRAPDIPLFPTARRAAAPRLMSRILFIAGAGETRLQDFRSMFRAWVDEYMPAMSPVAAAFLATAVLGGGFIQSTPHADHDACRTLLNAWGDFLSSDHARNI